MPFKEVLSYAGGGIGVKFLAVMATKDVYKRQYRFLYQLVSAGYAESGSSAKGKDYSTGSQSFPFPGIPTGFVDAGGLWRLV